MSAPGVLHGGVRAWGFGGGGLVKGVCAMLGCTEGACMVGRGTHRGVCVCAGRCAQGGMQWEKFALEDELSEGVCTRGCMCVCGGGAYTGMGAWGRYALGVHTPGDVHGSGEAQDCVQWDVCAGVGGWEGSCSEGWCKGGGTPWGGFTGVCAPERHAQRGYAPRAAVCMEWGMQQDGACRGGHAQRVQCVQGGVHEGCSVWGVVDTRRWVLPWGGPC